MKSILGRRAKESSQGLIRAFHQKLFCTELLPFATEFWFSKRPQFMQMRTLCSTMSEMFI